MLPQEREGFVVARFDRESHADLPTRSVAPYHLTRHLLGPDRMGLTDGRLDDEEFRCALALDAQERVEHWVRNPSRHRASFWLPTATTADTLEKAQIGELWARRTGNVFLIVEAMKHGEGPEAQMRRVLLR